MKTRDEHLAWCKERALEYVRAGDLASAVASMLSDIDKHPDTALVKGSPLSMLGIISVQSGNPDEVRRFIVVLFDQLKNSRLSEGALLTSGEVNGAERWRCFFGVFF